MGCVRVEFRMEEKSILSFFYMKGENIFQINCFIIIKVLRLNFVDADLHSYIFELSVKTAGSKRNIPFALPHTPR